MWKKCLQNKAAYDTIKIQQIFHTEHKAEHIVYLCKRLYYRLSNRVWKPITNLFHVLILYDDIIVYDIAGAGFMSAPVLFESLCLQVY